MNDALAPFVSELCQSVSRRLSDADGPLACQFAEGLWGAVPPEELAVRVPDDDASATIACFRGFQLRQTDAFQVVIVNPEYDRDGWQSNHTIVQIFCPDMPFVVDSVLMALSHHDLVTHYLSTAVFRTQRDTDGHLTSLSGDPDDTAEGLIYAEIDRMGADQFAALRQRLEETLQHVRVVVRDFGPMKSQLHRIISELEADPGGTPSAEIPEVSAFLDWMAHENFTFLGYREFDYIDDEMRQRDGTSLGILTLRAAASVRRLSEQSPETRDFLLEPTLLAFSKSGTKSRVHRPAYPDSISVKRFDADGRVIGEQTFLGLYTSPVYTERPSRIPVLRQKVARIIENSPFEPSGFDGKVLSRVLSTYPRDELFQMAEAELLANGVAITYLHERRKTRVFLRRDRYGLFYTCLVFIPRELYNTQLRLKIQALLIETLGAEDSEFEPYFSESILVRLHFNLRVAPGSEAVFDADTVEQQIVDLASDWLSELNDALIAAFGESRGRVLSRRFASAFPAGYREQFTARTAAYDVSHIERLSDSRRLVMRFSRLPETDPREMQLKVFHLGEPLPLSDLLPQLEHMGLRVTGEHPYQINLASHPVSIQDFSLEYRRPLELEQIGDRFEDAFIRIWERRADDDDFNRLILAAGLTWRQASILRSYAHYMKQTRFGFGEHFIGDTLDRHPALAGQLVELFDARFDPNTADADRFSMLFTEFHAALDNVDLLNEDRILRRFAELIAATDRTNYYRIDAAGDPRPYLSFKLAPRRIADLPRPLPEHEIFVCAPHMEGVHLRGGPIARGGLRWSDRLEDYRTEVLGLAKAQVVKNAVIVPTGAKGGFVIKRRVSPQKPDEVTASYQDFIRGLLDVTDNLQAGQLAPPDRVVRYDDDDPYLVVAADKGTATFSDVANGVAADYGFWLDDAFASGGSQGYDHKKMGITARGAWVSVQRHFRERNIDVQTQSVRVIGIGDMSGDVFGNGMLMSTTLKLVAAFNHLHIFLDPDPDPVRAFAERQRLFETPGSTWADYPAEALSAGGGVYPRSAKAIELTAPVRALLNVEAIELAPDELINALLKAPVDLIWNGGIGTYVKATSESHADAGDRANDGIRIDAPDLRAHVFGEGGNLGMTQAARVEFALRGGAVNTDFIDNAGGVDCSDHEVNIKILLNSVVNAGDMTVKQRNQLLEDMTDAVAKSVLTNTFRQAQALSLAQRHAQTRLGEYQRFIALMEHTQDLDRTLEAMPTDDVLSERFSEGGALSRPELAVLLAYAKIHLKEALIASRIDDDPAIAGLVRHAFPAPLRERFEDHIGAHQLRRQLLATELANDLVHHVGITFISHLGEFIGSSTEETVRAYLAAMDIFGIRDGFRAIEALDVSEETRLTLMLEQMQLGRRATRWLLRHRRAQLDVGGLVAEFQAGVAQLRGDTARLLGALTTARREADERRLSSAGVPDDVVRLYGNAALSAVALPVSDAAKRAGVEVMQIVDIYAELAATLRLDWLIDQLVGMTVASHWQTMERDALLDDVTIHLGALATRVIRDLGDAPRVTEWLEAQTRFADAWRTAIESAQHAAIQDFSLFSMTCRKLNDLCEMLNSDSLGPIAAGKSD